MSLVSSQRMVFLVSEVAFMGVLIISVSSFATSKPALILLTSRELLKKRMTKSDTVEIILATVV